MRQRKTAGLTAVAALDALELSPGEGVLVVGATGGVGTFFVQLAAAAGAHVIAPTRDDDREYLHELGVSEVVERDHDVAEQVRERFPDGVNTLSTSSPSRPMPRCSRRADGWPHP